MSCTSDRIIRGILTFIVIVNFIGCTTMHKIDAPPSELHYKIKHENIVNVHDWVRVTTEDGTEYRFQVTKINETVIQGDDVVNNTVVTVPIDNIDVLETQDINTLRTSLVFGLPIAAYVLMLFAVGAALAL